LALIVASIFFVCLNCIIAKYNVDVWCRNTDNYDLAMLHLRDSHRNGMYSSAAHYIFTFVSIVVNLLFLGCIGQLSMLYEEKKEQLVRKKLKSD